MSPEMQRLHELCMAVTNGDLRRPWAVQTSDSYRRIGTDRADGNVLRATTQPDGHPDLVADRHVLDYIVAVHPFTVLGLIHERDRARHAIAYLRHEISEYEKVFTAYHEDRAPANAMQRLQALCSMAIADGELRRPWVVQTSNSHRRIGTDLGDGNVVCANYAKRDAAPDLLAPSGVLEYIAAAHPFTVLGMLTNASTRDIPSTISATRSAESRPSERPI
jgi:hypothetical protein